jgi:hypothetical protein
MATTRSNAYAAFEAVAERSLHLLSLEKTLRKPIGGTLDLSDLVRAAIVLAVAGMDAYFTDVFAEKLIPYLREREAGPTLVQMLSDAGLDTREALNLLRMKRPYRRVRKLIENSLDLHTTQRQDVVDKLFIAYGIKDFCKNAQGIAHRPTLLASVGKLVKRRNAIVHDGDLNKHGKLQVVDPDKCRRAVEAVVKFVSASETLIGNRLP